MHCKDATNAAQTRSLTRRCCCHCAPAAMRGEFDPPAWEQNTERSSGLLLDSLTRFPAVYEFQLVVKQPQVSWR